MNANVHLHLCMLDGVVAQGRQGLVFGGARVDEACAERAQAAVRRPARARAKGESRPRGCPRRKPIQLKSSSRMPV